MPKCKNEKCTLDVSDEELMNIFNALLDSMSDTLSGIIDHISKENLPVILEKIEELGMNIVVSNNEYAKKMKIDLGAKLIYSIPNDHKNLIH